jgi:glycosidase
VRLRLRLICAVPGMPCVYYGDEAGMEGAADPFCRAPSPGGREDAEQHAFYRARMRARRDTPALRVGHCALCAPDPDVLAVIRRLDGGVDAFGAPAAEAVALCAVNRADAPRQVRVPVEAVGRAALLDESGRALRPVDGCYTLRLPALGGAMWKA